MLAVAAAGGCGTLIVSQRSVVELQGRQGFTWHRHEIDGLIVHVEDGPEGSAIAIMAADTAAYAMRHLLAYLEAAEFTPATSLFVVRDRARMAELIGRATNATAYHSSYAICVVLGDALTSRIAHELFHVIAMNLWGIPQRWVNEGAAVDADTRIRGVDVHVLSRRLMDRGDLPSVGDLAGRFEAFPSEQSYIAAGSFVRFVRETHGIGAVRALWDGGLPRLEAHVSVNATSLDTRWRARVARP